MKKLLSIVFAFMVALTALPAHAADFTAQQMKKMSIFLSNFTAHNASGVTELSIRSISRKR